MQTRQKYARTDMIDYKSNFPMREYSRVVLCIAIFFYLLICYNGLWNMALYPAEAKYTDTISSFLEICQMLTPATLIVISFGALSVLELVCTVQDNAWKTVMEMILWSLLTMLMNSFIAYQMSLGNNAGLGTWMILITTSVVNIVWYISTIILLKRSKSLHKLAEKLEEKENDQDENVNKLEPKILCTKDLAYSLLREIGANPQETEEGRIKFEYQGVVFLMEAINECKFVNLIWPWCHSFSKFDIDEFARVRQVVNDINMRGTSSVFYGITDSDDVAVHIKKHFLFVQQIPDLESYLKITLDSFFRTARTLDIEVEKCRLQECER